MASDTGEIMKPLAGILILLFVTFSAYSQTDKERADWTAALVDNSKLATGADRNRILQYDFAPLWTRLDDNDSVLGYIAPGYQRMRIALTSITKSASQPDTYNVTGKSMVKGVVRPFAGTMKITKVSSSPRDGMEEEYASEGLKEVGFVVGEYHFAEDAKQTNTGKFDGVFATDWVVDKDGKLLYDEVMMGADGYYNNQFLGTWTSYRTKASKAASWGDSRIPLSGDLDMGSGEFAPDRKYIANGWQNHVNAYGPKQDKRALAEENRQWWK